MMECSVSYRSNHNYAMPQKFLTIADSTLVAMEAILKENYEDEEMVEVLFANFRLYQENRLKINKESRESKMEQRKEGGGAPKRSAKMTGVVRLVAVEGEENVFKVEKVSVPAPAPAPEAEEENLAENPEALAAAVAEAAATRAAITTPAQVVSKYTKKGGSAPRAALLQGAQMRADAKEAKKRAPRKNLKVVPAVVAEAEDSGEETEDAIEACD